jgi:hypothetical protein
LPHEIAKAHGYEPSWLVKAARQFYNHGEFIEFIMRDQKQRRNVGHFASKLPLYLLHLASLLERFPSGRFICLVRDGRDVALSLRKSESDMGSRWWNQRARTAPQAWRPGGRYWRQGDTATHDEAGLLSMGLCAQIWRTSVNAFRPFEAHPRCTHVRYEDLITRPQEVLKDLCDFLEIPFEQSMLTFHVHGTEGRDLEETHMLKVKMPFDASHVALWKKEMTAEQVREFERIAGAELRHAGYEVAMLCSTQATAKA